MSLAFFWPCGRSQGRHRSRTHTYIHTHTYTHTSFRNATTTTTFPPARCLCARYRQPATVNTISTIIIVVVVVVGHTIIPPLSVGIVCLSNFFFSSPPKIRPLSFVFFPSQNKGGFDTPTHLYSIFCALRSTGQATLLCSALLCSPLGLSLPFRGRPGGANKRRCCTKEEASVGQQLSVWAAHRYLVYSFNPFIQPSLRPSIARHKICLPLTRAGRERLMDL